MNLLGSHNRTKGLYGDDGQIENAERRSEKKPFDVDLWLLCHPHVQTARDIFDAMLAYADENAPEVSHDDVVSWLATAIRCHPQNLVPQGEAVGIREKPTIPVGTRCEPWDWEVGTVQTCRLLELLEKCSFARLTVDERANVIFALLRISRHSEQVMCSVHLEPLLRRLHPAASRVETIEALAAIFFQLSEEVGVMAEAIRLIWKTIEDEPLILRLTVEILMCLCQRAEIAGSLPDFRMGDQMYCNQVRVIILDLTSDAHEQVQAHHEKNELSRLVNEVFNLKRREDPAHSAPVATI